MIEQPQASSRAVLKASEAILMPTPHGIFRVQAWRSTAEHLSLTSLTEPTGDPLVRIHSECATGDIFGSFRCDCGEQLDDALEAIQRDGGSVVYMRGHEGRGIGLFNKIRAYHLQDEGDDTVDANTHLGLPIDARTYDDAAAILRTLGYDSIRLISNNPAKDEALEKLGITVSELVPSIVAPHDANTRYLDTKRERMHHRLPTYIHSED